MKPIDFIYRFDPANPSSKPQPRDAVEARELLEAGNRLFAEWTDRCLSESPGTGSESYVVPCDPQDLGVPAKFGKAAKQAPFAVLMGCSDARVPAEMIFGQVRNNLFVIRVAGNVLADECLGSVAYAVEHLKDSIRIIVVLGHTGCGAVSAAVDTYLNPWAYLAKTGHAVRSIVDRIFVPVRKAARALESVWGAEASQLPFYREALIETAVFVNAAQAAYNLRLEMEQEGRPEIHVVYGVFDLLTHRVWTAPEAGEELFAKDVKLAEAPTTIEVFEERALRMAIRIARKFARPKSMTDIGPIV